MRCCRRGPRASIHIQRRQMYETKLLTMNNGFLKYINGCNKAQFIYFSIRIMVIFASFNRIQLIILFGCCFHSFFISSFLISIFRVVMFGLVLFVWVFVGVWISHLSILCSFVAFLCFFCCVCAKYNRYLNCVAFGWEFGRDTISFAVFNNNTNK